MAVAIERRKGERRMGGRRKDDLFPPPDSDDHKALLKIRILGLKQSFNCSLEYMRDVLTDLIEQQKSDDPAKSID